RSRRGTRRHRRDRRASAGLRADRRRDRRRGAAGVPGRRRARARVVTAVAVEDLRKSYGGREALKGITFEIREGEVFSLLGPNGAGKTTTIEILEGYRRRDGGSVAVLGADPARTTREWRARIGVVLQSS